MERFLDQVVKLYGERPTGEERRRLAARRLAFLLTRKVIYLVLKAWPLAQAQSRLPPIDVDGLQHLEAALAGSGGAVLVTAHFGFPVLVGPVLATRGVDVVAAGAASTWVDESLVGNLWDRARALRRLQARLAGRSVCVFLPDSARGVGVEVPFLAARVRIGLGAFALAQQAGCPVLPVFGVRWPETGGFRVEFGPPFTTLGSLPRGLPIDAAHTFGRVLESYARRLPDHLFCYEPGVLSA